jgi:hypothetical protein
LKILGIRVVKQHSLGRAGAGQWSMQWGTMQRILTTMKSVVLIIGITTFLLAITLGVGEFLARVIPEYKARGTAIGVENQTFAYHPWSAFGNTPGFVYQLGNLKVVKINKYGWRGPEPKIERTKNVRRAILLGDSVPFSGWGCREGVTLGGALTRALELRTGDAWEVINMAVGGGFSSMSLATLAHEGMKFNPDAIVSLNGTNDLLTLDHRFRSTFLGHEDSTYQEILYHAIQAKIQDIYDPRTGLLNQRMMIDSFLAQSALYRQIRRFFNSNNPTSGASSPARRKRNLMVPSLENLDRLDHYVNNELAMSYLATGAGVSFVAFLQPYLSLKHKVVGGDIDREVIDRMNDGMPALLPWLDTVYPVLRSKLEAAAATHPSLNFVDLSLMFTNEQVFADNAHMRCEEFGLSIPGNELMAARMADEMVSRVYRGQKLPDWRKTHIEGTPHDWNDQAYLDANPDVAALVAAEKYPNGYKHYTEIGFLKGRPSGFPSWNETSYLEANPDVAEAVKVGRFASGFDHYLKAGRAEGRLKGLRPRWVEDSYLWVHQDVVQAIKRGDFTSGLDHYTRAGAKEGRNGGFSGWDEEGYLIAHGDVRNAMETGAFTSGLDHYFRAGAAERRPIRLGTYLQKE